MTAFLRDAEVLMVRIPDKNPQQAPAPRGTVSGAGKYHGEIAEGYDAKREDTDKWRREQELVTQWLTELADPGHPVGAATSVIDVPVGTGRFIHLYSQLGLSALGLDISDDMLAQASEKARGADKIYLRSGDARELGDVGQYDVAICCRLMRWLETNEAQLKVLHELMRVARKAVIFNVRESTGPLPLAPEKILDAAAQAGWKVTERATIVDDFTMYRLERADEVG